MVVAALWMTISFTMLFSVPQSCAFEATDGEPEYLNIPSEYCNNLMPVIFCSFDDCIQALLILQISLTGGWTRYYGA